MSKRTVTYPRENAYQAKPVLGYKVKAVNRTGFRFCPNGIFSDTPPPTNFDYPAVSKSRPLKRPNNPRIIMQRDNVSESG